MNQDNALQQFTQIIRWTSGTELDMALAVLSIAAYIVWFAWLIQAQMPRLRGGEISVRTLLGESGRALFVVIAVIAVVAFLI